MRMGINDACLYGFYGIVEIRRSKATKRMLSVCMLKDIGTEATVIEVLYHGPYRNTWAIGSIRYAAWHDIDQSEDFETSVDFETHVGSSAFASSRAVAWCNGDVEVDITRKRFALRRSKG